MKGSNSKIVKYYAQGHYKGFYPKKGEKHYKQSGSEVQITFTDGKKELTTTGKYREQALSKIFKAIDSYKENKSKPLPKVASD